MKLKPGSSIVIKYGKYNHIFKVDPIELITYAAETIFGEKISKSAVRRLIEQGGVTVDIKEIEK